MDIVRHDSAILSADVAAPIYLPVEPANLRSFFLFLLVIFFQSPTKVSNLQVVIPER